jgi:hypothetical protein
VVGAPRRRAFRRAKRGAALQAGPQRCNRQRTPLFCRLAVNAMGEVFVLSDPFTPLAHAHPFNRFSRPYDKRMPPLSQIQFGIVSDKGVHGIQSRPSCSRTTPPPASMSARPPGDMPEIRGGQTGHLQQSRGNQCAFQCRGSCLARLPARLIDVGNDRHAGEPPQTSRIDLGRHVGPVEAKLRVDARVINARTKSVADRAPDRARNRAAPMENADRRCEQRKAGGSQRSRLSDDERAAGWEYPQELTQRT